MSLASSLGVTLDGQGRWWPTHDSRGRRWRPRRWQRALAELTNTAPITPDEWKTVRKAWNGLVLAELLRLAKHLDVDPSTWARFAVLCATTRVQFPKGATVEDEDVATLEALVKCISDSSRPLPHAELLDLDFDVMRPRLQRRLVVQRIQRAVAVIAHLRNGVPAHELLELTTRGGFPAEEVGPVTGHLYKLIRCPTEDEIIAAAVRRRLGG